METVKVRGLLRLSAWVFAVWGVVAAVKGCYDLLGGEPEANLYAPAPWAFVSRPEWLRYAAFETVYGLACVAVAWLLVSYSRFLPESIQRAKREEEFVPFR